MKKLLRTLAAFTLLGSGSFAQTPDVVTSIAPLQGIVGDIMKGAGSPVLLLNEPMSPHDFAARPSQLRALNSADLVLYVGLQMEPWIIKPLSQIPDTVAIALGEVASPNTLAARELKEFGSGNHEEHPEGPIDPHVWLSPENVLVWIDVISGLLEEQDPDNADLYRANTEALRTEILKANDAAKQSLADLKDIDIIVTHDSLQYLEEAFDLNVIGSFSGSDGQKTGARNASRLLSEMKPETCFVEDINEPSAVIDSLPDNIRVVRIDPLGFDLVKGGDYYPRLLSTLSTAITGCKP